MTRLSRSSWWMGLREPALSLLRAPCLVDTTASTAGRALARGGLYLEPVLSSVWAPSEPKEDLQVTARTTCAGARGRVTWEAERV